jgi:hypothetical protein
METAKFLLVVALELCGFVRAVLLGSERAAEESIRIWTFGVQRVVPVTTFVYFTEHCSRRLGRDLDGLRIGLYLGMVRSNGLLG